MTIDTLPEAEAIRLESRLRPEQVSLALADATELESDIDARITKYRAVVDKKLTDVTTSADNQIIATEALTLRVLASLFGSAGQLNPAYWERAQALKAESADLIDDLVGNSPDVIDAAENAMPAFSITPQRIDGYTCNEPEYSPC